MFSGRVKCKTDHPHTSDSSSNSNYNMATQREVNEVRCSITTNLVDVQLGEASLQHLVVGHVFEVLVGRPVDLAHGHDVWVHDIQKLARNGTLQWGWRRCNMGERE